MPLLQGGQGFEYGGELGGPAGVAEFSIANAFAGGRVAGVRDRRYKWGIGADGFGEVVAAGGVVVDGVEEAGEAVGSDMEEGAGGIVAVDEIDEGIGCTEREGLAGAGGFDEAGAVRAVDATEADGGATGLDGELLGLEQDVAGRCAAGRG